MFQIAFLVSVNLTKIDTFVFLGYVILVVGIFFQQALVWTIPPYIVRVLMKYFQTETTRTDIDVKEKSKKALALYESLTSCFSSFFICYFPILQIFSIFVTYLFLSMIYNFRFNLHYILYLFSFMLQFICNFIFMISITNSSDKCSQCINYLRSELEETLLCTQQKEERQYLKYLIGRTRDLKPMHACGYFHVDRTTLTSMLSVR